MTITLHSKAIQNGTNYYYVCMELDKADVYTVSLNPSYDYGKTYGYPLKEMSYKDKAKAKRCYNRYVREVSV